MAPDSPPRRPPSSLPRFARIVALAAAVAPLAIPASAADAPSAVVARRTGDALVVLDASPLVASLTASDAPAADANAQLERRAVRAIASKLPLVRDSRTVTARIVYARTAAVSPAYGDMPSQRIERYADVAMTTADATGDRDRWQEAAESGGPLPAWIRMTVVGELPPPR